MSTLAIILWALVPVAMWIASRNEPIDPNL